MKWLFLFSLQIDCWLHILFIQSSTSLSQYLPCKVKQFSLMYRNKLVGLYVKFIYDKQMIFNVTYLFLYYFYALFSQAFSYYHSKAMLPAILPLIPFKDAKNNHLKSCSALAHIISCFRNTGTIHTFLYKIRIRTSNMKTEVKINGKFFFHRIWNKVPFYLSIILSASLA